VTLLDAYALIALAANEPAAGDVERILRRGQASIVVLNLAEAIDVCRRRHGLGSAEIRDVIEPLFLERSLTTVVSEERHAWDAAELRTTHYDRKTRALSMADCLLLAHAGQEDAEIATADRSLAAVARVEGVTVVALPDSAGAKP
jgi:predicted nucleic acid-binding protein